MAEAVKPILLVEDNPDHAEITMDAIKNSNVVNPVAWVEDGESGLDYLYRRGKYADRTDPDPALVLLDIKLPGIDGLEVLAKIREDDRFAGLPVVMLTTSSQEGEILKAYMSHANSYVVKPMSFKEFYEKVQDLNIYWTMTNTCPEMADKWRK
ncbi:MAG: response regulator [Armatimonadia bacterium]